MVDCQEPYRAPEHIPTANSIRVHINNGFVDNISASLATWNCSKQWGLDVRASLALAVAWFSKKQKATPRGTYPTLAALKCAFPNGDGGCSIYAVLDSQRWYTTKNGAWQDGGVTQNSAIDAAKMDQIGQTLDNLSRNNLDSNACFQNGQLNNAVPSVAGVLLSVAHRAGTTWVTVQSPSGTVNNLRVGIVVPRQHSIGQPVIGTGSTRLGVRIVSAVAQNQQITQLPRCANGAWHSSLAFGTFNAHAQKIMAERNSAHIAEPGQEDNF